MRIDIYTLFPGMFTGPLTESILKRAQTNGLLDLAIHNIRGYAVDKHHITDEPPYGGGGGMIMKVDPIVNAVESTLGADLGRVPVILTTPTGALFTQAKAKQLSTHDRIAFVCGHYEGVDERVHELVVTEELSIGDYVLTGGELPAMVMIDAICRYLPGVLGAENAAEDDSHATGLLEHPHYTRPVEFRGLRVPDVLQNGNHAHMTAWKREQSLRRTLARRPDMLARADLTDKERALIAKLRDERDASQDHL